MSTKRKQLLNTMLNDGDILGVRTFYGSEDTIVLKYDPIADEWIIYKYEKNPMISGSAEKIQRFLSEGFYVDMWFKESSDDSPKDDSYTVVYWDDENTVQRTTQAFNLDDLVELTNNHVILRVISPSGELISGDDNIHNNILNKVLEDSTPIQQTDQ